MMGRAADFLRDESGQAATEYILIVAMISIPIYIAFKKLFEVLLKEFISALIKSFTRG